MVAGPGRSRRRRWLGAAVLGLLLTASACTGGGDTGPEPDAAPSDGPFPTPTEAPTDPPVQICDHMAPGPDSPPDGAVTIDPDVPDDLQAQTQSHPAGTTYWLAPGRHILGTDQFSQVIPKDGDSFIGAPGAILDGQRVNLYAFTSTAQDVTIRYLTVQGFVAPQDQGVVNHDSGNGWDIEDSTIQDNEGAGLMAGAGQVVRRSCLRNNGQYGMNAFQAGDGITGLVLEGNEITGNNTGDWESRIAGCGCSGGVKFWAVDGADVRSNWVHDNHGVGLWADTNDNDFLVEGNLIEDNDAEGLFYEISYNLELRFNTLRGNARVKGQKAADAGDNFPVAALYLSESGGDPRVKARTDRIDVHDNVFENNWAGITAWENADRFCNSPANTSTAYCTLVGPTKADCAPPAIADPPLVDTCRWKTQRLDVHDNTFTFDPAALDCPRGPAGTMALISNYGTYPDWSPYKADTVEKAITFDNDNTWRDNTYRGPWRFVVHDTGQVLGAEQWQDDPYDQDSGSSFDGLPPERGAAAC